MPHQALKAMHVLHREVFRRYCISSSKHTLHVVLVCKRGFVYRVCRYAWVLAECAACTEHMGWRFTAVSKETRPKAFWGIRRSQLADNSS